MPSPIGRIGRAPSGHPYRAPSGMALGSSAADTPQLIGAMTEDAGTISMSATGEWWRYYKPFPDTDWYYQGAITPTVVIPGESLTRALLRAFTLGGSSPPIAISVDGAFSPDVSDVYATRTWAAGQHGSSLTATPASGTDPYSFVISCDTVLGGPSDGTPMVKTESVSGMVYHTSRYFTELSWSPLTFLIGERYKIILELTVTVNL